MNSSCRQVIRVMNVVVGIAIGATIHSVLRVMAGYFIWALVSSALQIRFCWIDQMNYIGRIIERSKELRARGEPLDCQVRFPHLSYFASAYVSAAVLSGVPALIAFGFHALRH